MYSPKDYWSNLAEGFESMDRLAFGPVLHPQAPPWFNRVIDNLQYRALRRALTIAANSPGARFLDVGCGTGRWVRRYTELGFWPVGVDATFGMLRIARARHTDAPLAVGLAQSLPFSDSVFDCLSDITVVQHIPYDLQSTALREMVRVLKPGGRMILLELTRGEGSHVFPRSPRSWIGEVESHGTALIGWFGEEFFFLDRLFVRLAQTAFARSGNHAEQTQSSSPVPVSEEFSLSRRLYWRLRRITVPFSAWIEPAVAKICPARLATHAVFVFRKRL
jgi:ubiquinone/menaquinone biosynthesis C-methylase UbiE